MSLITFHHWWFSEVHSLCSMCLLCEYMVHKHYAEYWILLLLICMWAELLQNLARVFVFFPAGCHLLPNSDTIHQRDLASTNLLAAWESVKLVPTVRRRSRLHTVLILSPLFFFFRISVRVAQILVVAHKPHPPGRCILEAGMTFCRWLVKGSDAGADRMRTRLSL